MQLIILNHIFYLKKTCMPFFFNDSFGINYPMKVDMPLNKKIKPNFVGYLIPKTSMLKNSRQMKKVTGELGMNEESQLTG